jgi:ankyrin repeat protein
MSLHEAEVRELQEKYSHLTNYESDDPEDPIDPMEYRDSNGDALLHIAAQSGDGRTIDLLLKAGVDVNLVGDMGNTALHYAKTEDVFNLLLIHGASREIINEFGRRPELKGGV